jgi:acetoin utilization deacetylase AcuC-like enzyme
MTMQHLPLKETALLWSEKFLGHDTGHHVERPARAVVIRDAISRPTILAERPDVYVQSVSTDLLRRVHDPHFLEALERFSRHGGGWIDPDTWLGPDSLEVAAFSAGAAVSAVQAVLNEQAARAFSLGRPPGHHATRDRAMGFCFYNNVALAAQAARDEGMERIAIVDWDVHHGNGTQDIFYDRRDVLFCSVHQAGLFPGTGQTHELGNDKGEGFTLNVPLRAGQGDAAMLRVIDEIFTPAIRSYNPELILISAGFDAHEDDPLGDMRVTDHGFAQMADRICALSEEVCDGRVVAVLEGGYDLDALARSVSAVISVLDGQVPDRKAAAHSSSQF